MPRAPVISISHGGGPLPLMNHPSHTQLTHSLQTKVPQILRLGTSSAPRAIIVVTAHWEQPTPTVSSAASHPLYYDYSGFPPHTYRLHYDAPGSPAVAQEVFTALHHAGLEPRLDPVRGWDHGVFVPLMLALPAADVPIVQMSVLPAADEAASVARLGAIGAALAPLRDANVAIIGSGLASVHNMRLLQMGASDETKARLRAFSAALGKAVAIRDPQTRGAALKAWREFEGADFAHRPGAAEHFFPLLVCAGAAGEAGAEMWVDEAMGLEVVSYYWE